MYPSFFVPVFCVPVDFLSCLLLVFVFWLRLFVVGFFFPHLERAPLLLQERASMLLVHGLIHLLGYDHETEQDYEAMVDLEEKILAAVFTETSEATAVAAAPEPATGSAGAAAAAAASSRGN